MMLLHVCMLLFTQAVVGPEAPSASNSAFQRTSLAVQQLLEKGEFPAAQKLARKLPHRSFKIEWDDSGVPAARKSEFGIARDSAITAWKALLPDLKVELARKGDIKIDFVPSLPPNADSPGPAGAVFFYSDAPEEPRLESVIALVRGEKKLSITPREVRNEVLFSIGSYLGLERMPRLGSAMDRREHLYDVDNRVLAFTANLAKQTLAVTDRIDQAIAKKRKLIPARPQIFVEPRKLTHGEVVQGDRVEFTCSITNRGNCPLRYRVVQDCGCIGIVSGTELDAGQTTMVRLVADTTEYPQGLDKTVFIYSNDPDEPSIQIPVHIDVTPKFRFLRRSNAPIELVTDQGLKLDVYLVLNDKSPLKPLKARIDGIAGVTEMVPWEGEIPDHELNEPSKHRKGYMITILAGPEVPPGRIPMTLAVDTDDKLFSSIRTTIYVQKGIVALPPSVYLGEMGKEPSTATFLVTRPGTKFKIQRIESGHPCLSATYELARDDWEYRVTIHYNGKADFGNLAGVLKVYTDDPKQPVIQVPVTGVVR
jgi:hypothetical protein